MAPGATYEHENKLFSWQFPMALPRPRMKNENAYFHNNDGWDRLSCQARWRSLAPLSTHVGAGSMRRIPKVIRQATAVPMSPPATMSLG